MVAKLLRSDTGSVTAQLYNIGGKRNECGLLVNAGVELRSLSAGVTANCIG